MVSTSKISSAIAHLSGSLPILPFLLLISVLFGLTKKILWSTKYISEVQRDDASSKSSL